MLKNEIKDLLVECASSTKTCCKVFYPDRFNLGFSTSHDTVFNILDDDSIQFAAIAAWRGFGKSSLVQLGYPTKRILFRDSNFILPISNSLMQAQMHSENLKREFERNPIINKLGFKNLKSSSWSKDSFIVNNCGSGVGAMVMPRGYGQQVRGLLHGNSRPDLILVDDLEDSESVLSDEQRSKRLEWFYSDLMGSIDKSSKNYRIIYIGTILHADSLLNNLLEDPNWHSVRLSICDEEGNTNWPEQIDNEGIKKMMSWYREQGIIDAFYREYRNQPMSKEDAPFKSSCFNYFDLHDIKNKVLEKIVVMDPAKSIGGRACDTAIVGIGIDVMDGRFYILDMEASQMHPAEQITAALEMCGRIGARVLGVEVTGSGEYISWPIKNAIVQQGLNIEFVELKARSGPSQYVPHGSSQHGKDARIGSALVAVYNQGLIYHNREHRLTQKLESQLLSFPRGKHKDLIDALAYTVGMMHIGDRVFATKRLLTGNGRPETAFLDEEYESLKLRELVASEPRNTADWRV